MFQNGAKPDGKRVYQNADACVDTPGNFFLEEILEALPDCEMILSKSSWKLKVESKDRWKDQVNLPSIPTKPKNTQFYKKIIESS